MENNKARRNIIRMMHFLNFNDEEKYFMNRFKLDDKYTFPSVNNKGIFFTHILGDKGKVLSHPKDELLTYAISNLSLECKSKLLRSNIQHKMLDISNLLKKFYRLDFLFE